MYLPCFSSHNKVRVYFLVELDPHKHKCVKGARRKHKETLFKGSGTSYLGYRMRNSAVVALFGLHFSFGAISARWNSFSGNLEATGDGFRRRPASSAHHLLACLWMQIYARGLQQRALLPFTGRRVAVLYAD